MACLCTGSVHFASGSRRDVCLFNQRRFLARSPLKDLVEVSATAVNSEPSGSLSACVLWCLRACAWKCESVFWLCNSRLHSAIWHTFRTQEFKRRTDRQTHTRTHALFLFVFFPLPFGRVHFLILFPSSHSPILLIVTDIICKCTHCPHKHRCIHKLRLCLSKPKHYLLTAYVKHTFKVTLNYF